MTQPFVTTQIQKKGRHKLRPPATPPLENGARLTMQEFERRYQAMPNIKKAELLEGVVYMPSPVHIQHSRAHSLVMVWLGIYMSQTPTVELHDNVTLRLDTDNEVQPDALLRLENGRSRISEEGYLEGAPELIVEVAASSASYDLFEKKNVYRRNGVQEYIVWRVYDETIDWFRLEEGRYAPVLPDADGVIHSQIFPGLHLAVDAMLAADLARVLTVLHEGLAAAASLEEKEPESP